MLVPGTEGRAAIGLDVDRRGRIFVAGGPTGMAFVYDAETGAELAVLNARFGTPPAPSTEYWVTQIRKI